MLRGSTPPSAFSVYRYVFTKKFPQENVKISAIIKHRVLSSVPTRLTEAPLGDFLPKISGLSPFWKISGFAPVNSFHCKIMGMPTRERCALTKVRSREMKCWRFWRFFSVHVYPAPRRSVAIFLRWKGANNAWKVAKFMSPRVNRRLL